MCVCCLIRLLALIRFFKCALFCIVKLISAFVWTFCLFWSLFVSLILFQNALAVVFVSVFSPKAMRCFYSSVQVDHYHRRHRHRHRHHCHHHHQDHHHHHALPISGASMSPFMWIQPSALEQNERKAMLYATFLLSETQQQSYVIQAQGAPQLLSSYYWTCVTNNSLILHSFRALPNSSPVTIGLV